MRGFGDKRSTAWGRDERPAAAESVPGKRVLTDMLPAAAAPVQRKPTGADSKHGIATTTGAPGGAAPEELAQVPHSAKGVAEQPGATLAGSGTAPASASTQNATTRATLQMLFGFGPAANRANAHAAAARGIATPATQLPFADRIQRAFGRHDISRIQAHVGGDAAASARDMGARAYATGDHVVLGERADLRTVAHEAAHVIQQRSGVQLDGGVGQIGDPYERQADEVADRVVQGGSAEDLLDHQVGAHSRLARTSPPGGAAVQKEEGEIGHQANVGAGTITARMNDYYSGYESNDNYSLEYAGADANHAQWIQFANLKFYGTGNGKRIFRTGVAPTTARHSRYSTSKETHWYVDSTETTDPYYSTGGTSEVVPGRHKIFDAPGGKSMKYFAKELVAKHRQITRVTCAYEFDSYLMMQGRPVYHVVWTATTHYDPVKKSVTEINYETRSAGQVGDLPDQLKVVLLASYPQLAPPAQPQSGRSQTAPAAARTPQGNQRPIHVDPSQKIDKKKKRNRRRKQQRKRKRMQQSNVSASQLSPG